MTTGALPKGIDVASYQGNPDWDAVRGGGYAFAFTKATEGVDYTNPTFNWNWSEIRRVGMARGCYHYARPEYGNSAVAEADYFVASVLHAGGLETGDILALDLEPTQRVPRLAAWSLAWLRRVEQLAGVKPLVYAGRWVIDAQGLGGVAELGDYGLWLAAYQEAMPSAPAPWPVVAFWQFTDQERVPGIAGNCDANVFNGAPDRIAAYGKGGSAPAPAEPTFSVGPGILQAMAEHGESPAADEVFVKKGERDAWSEAVSSVGTRYIYLPSVGRVFRYPAA